MSRAILILVFAMVWAVKWGGLRDPGVIAWEPVVWVLGWTPSFLAAFGLPFLWPALKRRVAGRATSVAFLPECLLAAALLTAGELFDWAVPQIGDTAPQTFAVSDLIATLAGAATAFVFYRAIASTWARPKQ